MRIRTGMVVCLALLGCKGGDDEEDTAEVADACLGLADELTESNTISGDTTGGDDLLDSSCMASGPESLVSFTAPDSGSYTVSVAGTSGFDTVLSVWDSCEPAGASELVCNDDGPSGLSFSEVSFTAVAGQTVMIAVEGYQGATGAFELSVGPGNGGDPIDPCVDDPDSDGDGFDRVECGGTDCDDFDATVQEGTDSDGDGYFVECGFTRDCDDTDANIPVTDGIDIVGDGIDQDCNGSDAMATCTDEGPRDGTATGTVDCGTFDVRPYDVWEVAVTAGDCVDLFVDNDELAADLLGFVHDANGISGVTGLATGGFDDNAPCTVTPHNGFQCPAATVTAVSTGTLSIGIGQFGEAGAGCQDAAGYTLSVAINGVAATPTQASDDVDLTTSGDPPPTRRRSAPAWSK